MALTQSKSCISLLGSTSVSNDSLNCHAFLMSSQLSQQGIFWLQTAAGLALSQRALNPVGPDWTGDNLTSALIAPPITSDIILDRLVLSFG
ncbi:hypothetical protein WJX79_006150 [Trebouxia sp. C0005]